jgi:peptidoglycan/xylan/chitin deacetylase (PgdA/CDA1 family)
MLIAVNFHYIRHSFEAPYPSIFGSTPDAFERQLGVLGQAGEFVSAEQIRDAVRGGRALPRRSLVITFDDGLREQAELAWPILERKGVPAIFFINTAALAEERVLTVHKVHLLRARVSPPDLAAMLRHHAETRDLRLPPLDAAADRIAREHYGYDDADTARLKYLLNFLLSPDERDRLIEACFEEVFAGDEAAMSRALYFDQTQIRRLGDCIGSHAHNHLPLGYLSDEQAAMQIEQSLDYLAALTGRRPYALSYPYGSFESAPPRVAALARAAGIEFAFTMERAANAALTRPLHLARFDSNDLPGGKSPAWTANELFDRAPTSNWYK